MNSIDNIQTSPPVYDPGYGEPVPVESIGDDENFTLIVGKNLTADLSAVGNGHTMRDCNLSQIKAHTPVFSGLHGLVFEGCNLKNCDVPKDSIVKDCLVCHEDIVIESEADIALMKAKQAAEETAVDTCRIAVRAQLAECKTAEDVLTAIMEKP